jgi:hypothetical protein
VEIFEVVFVTQIRRSLSVMTTYLMVFDHIEHFKTESFLLCATTVGCKASFDVATFDVASIDIPSTDVASIDVASVDVVSIDVASIDFASFVVVLV